MKSKLLALLSASAMLFADDAPSESLWDYHPIHIGGNFLRIASADVTDTPLGGDLTYQKANAFLYMLLPLSHTSFIFPRVEWNAVYLNWTKNPKFDQTKFFYMQFGLTFYTIAIEQWSWILRFNYNLDIEHMSRPSQYGLFETLVWGSYHPHRKWHMHIGAFGYSGFEGSQFYPVIGADYSPNKKWKFLAIFPIDYSVQYKPHPDWRLSLKGRPLKERFRTNAHQPQPRSVFCYSSMGAELNVHYNRPMRFEVEVYGGWNFGGSYYIKDMNGHNPLYTDVGGALYGGANVDYAF